MLCALASVAFCLLPPWCLYHSHFSRSNLFPFSRPSLEWCSLLPSRSSPIPLVDSPKPLLIPLGYFASPYSQHSEFLRSLPTTRSAPPHRPRTSTYHLRTTSLPSPHPFTCTLHAIVFNAEFFIRISASCSQRRISHRKEDVCLQSCYPFQSSLAVYRPGQSRLLKLLVGRRGLASYQQNHLPTLSSHVAAPVFCLSRRSCCPHPPVIPCATHKILIKLRSTP